MIRLNFNQTKICLLFKFAFRSNTCLNSVRDDLCEITNTLKMTITVLVLIYGNIISNIFNLIKGSLKKSYKCK